jgi:glutaredoxin
MIPSGMHGGSGVSDGFWSLRNAPKWWFDKRAWIAFAIMGMVLLGWRWAHGPARVPQGQVVFYGASWCPYSNALREYLQASGIPFQERSVEDSFGNFSRYMWAAGRKSMLPVVQVGPRVVSKGFYREQIDPALRAAGYRPAEVQVAAQGGSAPR